MTGALIPVGSPLRVLSSDIGSVVPVVDIADMIGYNRSSITKAIKANEGAFEGLKTFQTLPTPGGDQQFLCLNHTGTERLFLLISPSSKTKRDLFIKVEEFRLKAFGKIEERKEIVQVQPAPNITAELIEARQYAEACQKPAEAFEAEVFRKHGKEHLIPALQQHSNLLVIPDSSQPGIWMTPTDIGRECGLSAREVNSWLYNHSFQYPEGPIWRLDKKGENFGEEYPFTSPYKHTELRIRWHRSILVASGLKRPLAENQTALPARAGAS